MEGSAALKIFWIISAAFLLLMLATGPLAAATASYEETKKIQALIRQVSNLKDAKFVRNGSTYNSNSAATFLRRKWQANQSDVQTARDFIGKVASMSGT